MHHVGLFRTSRLYWLVAIGCLLVGCFGKRPNFQRPTLEVTVETIQTQTIPAIFEFVGVIQSSHEVDIRARVTGYLDTIAFVEGSEVRKGDLLFQIDPRPFQTTLAKNRAQLAREEAVYWQAKRAVERFMPLYEQKAASQRDLDNAIAQQMSAEAQVMAARAQVADAELNLSYTTIASPLDGLTSQATYRVGSLISPGEDLLTTVSLLDPIWVLFSISEQDALKSRDAIEKKRLVFPPQNEFVIELILADGSLYPEKGVVNFASPSYSQKTGTMTIRAVLPNPDALLRPGQFVRVKIYGATRPNAIVVPQQAVLQGQKGPFVFVVNPDNRLEVRPVILGPWDGQNNWVIYEGLTAGDLVVVEGVNKMQPGAIVQIKKETPPPLPETIPTTEEKGSHGP